MSNTIALNFDMALVLGILLLTILLSLSNVIRIDVVAVFILVLLGLTRLLPPDQLFSGFSSEAVISLIAVMIIGAGLEKSGIAHNVARWVQKIGREQPGKIAAVLTVSSGLLSAFMRSLGTVALLLPVVTRITARTGIPKSRFLMPIAFCSILGGTLTMVGTSPLIILNSLLRNATHYVTYKTAAIPPFQLFSVLPLGAILLVVGLLYFKFFGRRLLPQEPIQPLSSGTTKTHFLKTYGKGGDFFELKILPESPFANITLSDVERQLDPSCSILAVLEENGLHFPPLKNLVLQPNALIGMMGIKEKIKEFAEANHLKLYPRLNAFAELFHPIRSGLSEAVIPPTSELIGQELGELHMKRNHQLHVLAVLRGNTVYQGDELRKLVLRSGDTLGIFCRWEALSAFHKNPDFVVLTTSYPREEIRPKKMWFALLFFILSLALIVFGKFSVSVGLLVGAVGMITTGVLTVDEAYASVSWRSVFLIAGLIPLGLVMQTTQTTDWLTQHIPLLRQDFPAWSMQAALAILTTAFSFVISGVGATIVLVPVALEVAHGLGADPRVFALTIAVAASNSFMMPMQQANVLIAGPGGYKTRDFVRVGFGMTILYWIVMVIVINLIY